LEIRGQRLEVRGQRLEVRSKPETSEANLNGKLET